MFVLREIRSTTDLTSRHFGRLAVSRESLEARQLTSCGLYIIFSSSTALRLVPNGGLESPDRRE